MAEEGNLTHAAEALGLRSPSLSQQIRALEEDLGTRLFERSATGMTLTASGEALLPEARAALADVERARRAVERADSAVRVHTVGLPAGVPASLPVRVRAAARALGAEVAFEDVATDRQLPRLRHGDLDLGVLTMPVEQITGLETRIVHREPLGMLMAEGHGLAANDRIDWEELHDQQLLWFPRERAPGYHDALLAACHAAGWRPRLRISTARRAITHAELTTGEPVVALRPAYAAEPGLVWRPLRAEAPTMEFAVAWMRDTPHPLLPLLARDLGR